VVFWFATAVDLGFGWYLRLSLPGAGVASRCFSLCAGIRFEPGGVFAFLLASGLSRAVCLPFCWHPRFAFVLQALPLCGAAPTFLCRRKEK
jgi:hypothetical protein